MPETTGNTSTRLLVFGMTRRDGQLRMDEVGRVAEQCGFSAEQVRSCVRRLVAEGLYERVRSGRAALYRTTELTHRALGEFQNRRRRAYQQDVGAAPWDGRWHLVAFAIPEIRRDTRGAFRANLRGLGGAAVQGGLYVSPHPWEAQVRATVKQMEIGDCVSFAASDSLEIGGVSEPRLLAQSLWPIEELRDRYESFLDQYRGVPDALEQLLRDGRSLDDELLVPGVLRMAEAWSHVSELEALLPAELLPQPWPGSEARDVLLRSRRLAISARRERGELTLFSSFDATVEDHSAPLGVER